MNRRSPAMLAKVDNRAQMLIRRLWTALETSAGRRIKNQELSNHLNLSDSALSDWIAGKTELYQIEALLRLCERLEHSTCADLFRKHLRRYPTLRSPELTYDPAATGHLRGLLSQSAGMTFVVDGTSSQRTWLLTALGHSYLEEGAGIRSLSGWDVHAPSWFVPLPGVLYLSLEDCEPINPRVDGLPNTLVLSNGLWQRFSRHRARLVRCASNQHVIVADAVTSEQLRAELKYGHFPLHTIHVAGDVHRLTVNIKRHQLQSTNLSAV